MPDASTVWMFISIISGLMVALSSWRYSVNLQVENEARSAFEKEQSRLVQVKQAIGVLKSELSLVRDELHRTLESFGTQSKTVSKLPTSAWITVSPAILAAGMPAKGLEPLMQLYRRINALNETCEAIFSLDHGSASYSANSSQKKSEYLHTYQVGASDLIALLNQHKVGTESAFLELPLSDSP